MNKLISIIIPVYNEEEVLPLLFERLQNVIGNIGEEIEFIFIDDGSVDNSLKLIEEFSQRDSSIKYISFSKNFGHQNAITAGIDYAKGDAAIIMDADLQDPPEIIPELIKKWREGYEVVYAVHEKREGESAFKRWTAKIFYRIIRRFSKLDIHLNAGDFRLIDRKVIEVLKNITEKSRFIRGLTSWIGYKQTGIKYKREKRPRGITKYPLLKMLRFSLDGITAFSNSLLHLATIFGFVGAFIGFVIGVYTIILKVFYDLPIAGWTSLMITIIFIGGIQLISIGLIGEYLGRVYDEVKNRPLYIVNKKKGFEDA